VKACVCATSPRQSTQRHRDSELAFAVDISNNLALRLAAAFTSRSARSACEVLRDLPRDVAAVISTSLQISCSIQRSDWLLPSPQIVLLYYSSHSSGSCFPRYILAPFRCSFVATSQLLYINTIPAHFSYHGIPLQRLDLRNPIHRWCPRPTL